MRKDILERKEEVLQWIFENESNAEIAKRLSCKVDTLKSYYKKWNIEYKGNQGGKGKSSANKLTFEQFLASSWVTSHKIRLRILEDKIKEHKCEQCNNTEWLGDPIPLELHHIDGDHYNNKLENLQLLCPNCHAKTNNYSVKK